MWSRHAIPSMPWLRMLANMKFIGNLFLRQLLAVKVIGQAVSVSLSLLDKSGNHPSAVGSSSWVAARWCTTSLALKMEERFQKNI